MYLPCRREREREEEKGRETGEGGAGHASAPLQVSSLVFWTQDFVIRVVSHEKGVARVAHPVL